MNQCRECRSYAINPGTRGRDESDLDLCDVCYWRTRAERLEAIVKHIQIHDPERVDAAQHYADTKARKP